MKARLSTLIALALLLTASSAYAHETLHSVEFGRAVAVKVYFADGEALAYVPYELFSPTDAKISFQKGRTDRAGYVAFMPDAVGKWRLRVIESSGHGLDAVIEVPATAPAAESSQPVIAFILRPMLGLAIVGAVFIILIVIYRRRGKRQ